MAGGAEDRESIVNPLHTIMGLGCRRKSPLSGKRRRRTDVPARRLGPWRVSFIVATPVGSLVGIYWGALAGLAVRGPSAVRIQSLAVLPLTNLSSDAEQEYLAEGMTEQMITELGQGQFRARDLSASIDAL